jgi:MFS family permease
VRVRAPFAWAVTFSFAARGVHGLLLPWLLLAAHPAGAPLLGWLQASAFAAQAAALLCLGGLGDRLGPGRVAGAAQLASVAPPLLLCLAGAQADAAALFAYAVVSGSLWGLVSPARDALLARSGGGDLLRPTAAFTAAQFAGQLAGIGLAVLAAGVGTRALLAGQALLHALAAAAMLAAPRAAGGARALPAPPPPAAPARAAAVERELLALAWLMGVGCAGPFLVFAPLLAAETARPAQALGLLLALFPLGSIAGSLALGRWPRRGRRGAVYAGHVAGSLALAAAGAAGPLAWSAACVALWGVAGGVFINCGRALLLETSPRARHARGLARVQLALLFASPIGAGLAGAAAGARGVHAALALFGVLSACAASCAAGRRAGSAAALAVYARLRLAARSLARRDTQALSRSRKRRRRRAQAPA